MSVSKYVDILTKVMDSVKVAIEKVRQKNVDPSISPEEYRSLIIGELTLATDDYLSELPDTAEYGAVVTLRDYGKRNREDVIRRIRAGLHEGVEESFRNRQTET